MFDDLVGPDDNDGKPALGPALVLRAPMGPSEMMMTHAMGLQAPLAVRTILFTEVDEATGTDVWETIGPPTFFDGAAHWQKKIMGWPVKPTIEVVEAFRLHAASAYLADWWDRLSSAKREDDERRPGDYAVKPAGRYAGAFDVEPPVRAR